MPSLNYSQMLLVVTVTSLAILVSIVGVIPAFAQQVPTTINLSNTNSGLSSFPSDHSVSHSGNNVYVIWTDTSTGPYDIFFKKSTDNGDTFGNVINLSNNNSTTNVQYAEIVSSGNNVYVIWTDTSTGGTSNVIFSKSTDNGVTFSTPVKLSNSALGSFYPRMTLSGSALVVSWIDNEPPLIQGGSNNSDVIVTKSTDGGNTFSTPINISNNSGMSMDSQITSYGNNVYEVWRDTTNPANGGIYFSKSTDGGNTFSTPVNVNNISGYSDMPYIDASGNNVYIIWYTEPSGGSDSDIFF